MTWEKALDPACRVSDISTTAGKRQVRPFQPPLPLLRVLQGGEAAAAKRTPEKEPRRTERAESAETIRSVLRVPVEPSPPESVPSQSQPLVSTGSRPGSDEAPGGQQAEVKLTQGLLLDIQDAVMGMRRFLAQQEEREERDSMERAWGNPEDLPVVSRSERRARGPTTKEDPLQRRTNSPTWPQSPWASARSPSQHPVSFIKMVGATEKGKERRPALRPRRSNASRPQTDVSETDDDEDESLEYLKKMYEDECEEIEEIDLGPDFVYPSQKAFDRYIGEFDFMKHLKHGIQI